MKRDYRDYLDDILTSMDEVAEFTRGQTYESFAQDKKTVNAVIRSLEVAGEAAKSLPAGLRAKCPDVPWKRMSGMRDKRVHHYFGVDLRIVWSVVTDEFPPLRPLIQRMRTAIDKP